jgi:hypothetical protein
MTDFNHHARIRKNEMHYNCGDTHVECPIDPDLVFIKDHGVFTVCECCTSRNLSNRRAIVKLHLSSEDELEFYELLGKATIMKWGKKLPCKLPHKYVERAFQNGVKKQDVLQFAQDAFSSDKPRNSESTIFSKLKPELRRVEFFCVK